MIETQSWSVILVGVGVCGWYTQIPCYVLHTGVRIIRKPKASRFYLQVGEPALARASVRMSGCWILHTLLVWCFTTGVINLFSECRNPRALRFRVFPIESHPVLAFLIPSVRASLWHTA